jgi:3-oxoacyl-(acyl-carrier-protein) synthase
MASTPLAITAAAVLCPLGVGWEETRSALMAGRSGVRPIASFDALPFNTQVAAEITGWTPPAHAATRIHAMLWHVAEEALRQAGLPCGESRIGVSVGIGRSPLALESIRQPPDGRGESMREYSGVAGDLAQRLGFSGPAYGLYTACASGSDAIGLAALLLRRGEVDAMLCGAADAQIAPFTWLEYGPLGAMAPAKADDLRQPRPFAADRCGFVMGEGAAMFMLETVDHARRRGARVMGTVLGYGSSSDAYSVVRGHPACTGAINAMRAALHDAGVSPECVDYVNAHGTGTIANDPLETAAIKQVLGEHAKRIPVSSTKSMTGHLFAAAASVELAFCLMALESGLVPPTINYTCRDPQCDLDYVPNEARPARLDIIMSNAFGFGGQNSVLVVGRA